MTARPAPRPRRTPPRAAARPERGSTSIEMVVLLPAMFALMFLGVQGAVWYQARTIVLAAAQEGARAAAAEDGSRAAGAAAAADFVAASRAGLTAPQVTAERSATTATVTVSASTVSLLPFTSPRVTQSASLPVERVTG